MDPVTALTIAGTFAWGIFQTAGGAVFESQSDRYFCDAVRQIKEKLSLNTPVENHELAKAFRRSCLKAALQICSRRAVSAGAQPSLMGRVSDFFHGAAPLGLMAQDEVEWVKRAEAHLRAKIDELNKNIPYLPEQAGEKYQTLINPAGVSSRERAERFRADLTDDAVAELRAAAGEAPESFKDEMHADWFGLVRNDFQNALSTNQPLANRFQNETLVEIVSGVDTLKLGIGEILSLLKSGDAGGDNQPLAVFNLLNLEEKVYDREEERAAILEELCGEVKDKRERFLLVTAPSGFGKSFLLTKVLQAVTDGRVIREEYRPALSKILRVDCRATQSVGGIVGDAGSLVGKSKALRLSYDLSREGGEPIAEWLNKHLFPALRQEGTVWLLLENFEAWLDAETGYGVKDASIRQFLNALFDGNHSLRVLFLSQDDPEPDVKRRLKKLERISEAIYQGLPEADALAYLRAQGEDVGLHRAEEGLLKEFLRRIHHIPQALASLIGYLRSIEGYSFQEFMADEELWAGFDEYEGVADTDDKGIRRTKALIARQIERQSDEVKLLLCALAFFEKDVPKQALELLFEKKAEAATAIARLTAHKLAATKTGSRGTTRYDLHAYFREQTAKKLLPQLAAWLAANGRGYAGRLYLTGMAAYEETKYKLAADLFSSAENITKFLLATPRENAGAHEDTGTDAMASLHVSALMMRGNSLSRLGQLREALTTHDAAIALFHRLAESDETAINDLAGAYGNKGIVLADLGRLVEAVAEYDKAIAIYEPPVTAGRKELANLLAAAYVNKGNALENLGRVGEAVAELDKAIAIYEPLVAAGREELANDLASAYMNKGNALESLGRLVEAVAEYDKAIAIYEPLVAAGREGLANDLASAYMNKGISLTGLRRIKEAVEEYDKAIAIREPLVAAGREELANDLAAAYVNKGTALANSPRIEEAVAELDKAIAIREPLVAAGREELANDLAAAYVNKGETLRRLERLNEASTELDKAVEQLEPLVTSGREELADDLAKAFANKALVLGQQQKWGDALNYYSRAIRAWEKCITQLGQFHLMPNLLKCYRLRVDLWLELERWAEAAADVDAAVYLFITYAEEEQIPDELKQAAGIEVGGIAALLRQLPPEHRTQLYDAAGEAAVLLRQLIED